jgi:hypothetical protein
MGLGLEPSMEMAGFIGGHESAIEKAVNITVYPSKGGRGPKLNA